MIFEKKMVILTGEGGAKGTIRTERRGGELKANYALYGVNADRVGLIAVCGGKRYEYDLDGTVGSVSPDPSIDVGNAHFIVSDGRRALMYGTLSPHRLWQGNLPHELKEREVKTDETQTVDAQTQTDFSYSTRRQRITDIFPSVGDYADNAVAEVNFYTSPVTLAPKADEALAQIGGKPTESARDAERAPENSGTDGIFGRVRGIRTAYLGQSFSDLTRSFVEARSDVTSCGKRAESDPHAEEAIVSSVRGNALKARMESSDDEIGFAPPPDGREATFYETMKDSIEKLFATGERETRLEEAMPFTRWVRIDYSGNGRYYVVGLIGDKPDYICYGLPAKYSPEPPEETDGKCGWLPLDPARPEGDGYWLMYQSATTGESVDGVV